MCSHALCIACCVADAFRISAHSDLEDLRQQQFTQAAESQSLSSQSQAMLNLNMKLKTSVLKSQVKAIDLELRKLEARQASEHLAMVKVSRCLPARLSIFADVQHLYRNPQPYLLPAFFESDSDAVDSLLFFERLAYKADLLSTAIEQHLSVNDALDGVVPDDFVGVCEVSIFISLSTASLTIPNYHYRLEPNLDTTLRSTSDLQRISSVVLRRPSSRWVESTENWLRMRRSSMDSSNYSEGKNSKRSSAGKKSMGKLSLSTLVRW